MVINLSDSDPEDYTDNRIYSSSSSSSESEMESYLQNSTGEVVKIEIKDDGEQSSTVKLPPPAEPRQLRKRQNPPKKPYKRPCRKKKVPKGYATQINWKEIEESRVESGPSASQVKEVTNLVRQGPAQSLPREDIPFMSNVVQEDDKFPVNFPFDKEASELFDSELTETDNDEAYRAQRLEEYAKAAPVYKMNILQLRQVFHRSFMSTRGIRATLFTTRLGIYVRRLAKKAKEMKLDGETPTARFRVIFEGSAQQLYEEIYTHPGKFSGVLKTWDELGCLYPTWEIDGSGSFFIFDLYIWVRYGQKWKCLSLSSPELGHPARLLATLNTIPCAVYPWPAGKYAVAKTVILLTLGMVPLFNVPPYAKTAEKLSSEIREALGLERELPHGPSIIQMDLLNRELENMLYRCLIASKWEELTTKEESSSKRLEKIGNLLEENFLTCDNAFTSSGSKTTPAESAFESLFAALPPVMTHFKEITPSRELLRCLLDGLSKLRFTENSHLMSLGAGGMIKSDKMKTMKLFNKLFNKVTKLFKKEEVEVCLDDLPVEVLYPYCLVPERYSKYATIRRVPRVRLYTSFPIYDGTRLSPHEQELLSYCEGRGAIGSALRGE
ncbi:Oidioi.mRNA.OKI2018_I69.XSR.g14645.t1.cds [Oikopleura dioica]|uniref:Oidioi.mRNA.OKI2018_I69.XSR.g14645.t1.cds n=2 Tax=Oikopleura dioica TaxID=34765 RepID=A0ABN7SED4_OIKDI|nr:Oidioi.mRNA.OKI2018_I69.XSR.g14645.t1.cds [Oikopleura dioica]